MECFTVLWGLIKVDCWAVCCWGEYRPGVSHAGQIRPLQFSNKRMTQNGHPSYLFTEVHMKAVCLLCSQHVSVKGYNLRRRQIRHLPRTAEERSWMNCRRVWINSSLIVCPEKRRAFTNISLTRNTVADRISDLSADLDSQLKHKVKSFECACTTLDQI